MTGFPGPGELWSGEPSQDRSALLHMSEGYWYWVSDNRPNRPSPRPQVLRKGLLSRVAADASVSPDNSAVASGSLSGSFPICSSDFRNIFVISVMERIQITPPTAPSPVRKCFAREVESGCRRCWRGRGGNAPGAARSRYHPDSCGIAFQVALMSKGVSALSS
ncbi:hypothetical protein J2T61_001888 [Methanocalculus sp. AMF5]|nr:hypothetical protein [Methanocalculus sp. AMF5]